MKKTMLTCAVLFLFLAAGAAAAPADVPKICPETCAKVNFIDANGDGLCDAFVDDDGNGVCDGHGRCQGQGRGTRFVDADGDGVCDGRSMRRGNGRQAHGGRGQGRNRR